MIKKQLKPVITLFKAHQVLTEFIKADIKDTKFDLNEFSVFEVVYHYETIKVQDIKDKVLVASSSLTYILDKLQRKNIIKRSRCKKDQRVIYISLTEHGKAVSNHLFPKHYEKLQALLNVLDTNEQETLSNLLKKLGLHTKEQL